MDFGDDDGSVLGTAKKLIPLSVKNFLSKDLGARVFKGYLAGPPGVGRSEDSQEIVRTFLRTY